MKWYLSVLVLPIIPLVAPAAAADFDATVGWSRRVELGTPVSGVVESVTVEPGDRVDQGQVLLVLEQSPFKAEVGEAEAVLKRRRRERLERLRELNRAKELYERQVLATVELEQADLHYTQADTAFREAGARLEKARYRLSRSRLRAPFKAVVVDRRVETGQNVVTALRSPVLLVLAEADTYLARVLLPVDELEVLKMGLTVTVNVGDNHYNGTVKTVALEPVSPNGDRSLYVVDIRFFAPDTLLRAGTTASVDLP